MPEYTYICSKCGKILTTPVRWQVPVPHVEGNQKNGETEFKICGGDWERVYKAPAVIIR